jgi:uncharacterized protein YndB with AHSA1/START domain
MSAAKGPSSKGEVIPEAAVRFVRALPAPVARVWQFLTEPSRLPEWYGDGAIEPREGGAVSLMGRHIRGVVTIWQPEKALGYTWSVFQPGESVSAWPVSYLEMALEADPASSSEAVGHQKGSGTRLTLTHRPIPEAMQEQTAMGWHTHLDLIAAALDGQFPKRADLFPRNAALYGVDINALKR